MQNIHEILLNIDNPEYLSLDKIKHKFFSHLKKEEIQNYKKYIQSARKSNAKTCPSLGVIHFDNHWYQELDRYQQFFNEFTKEFGEKKKLKYPEYKKQQMRERIFENLMEEAISSSQMEGAVTTRRAALEMIRTKSKPKTNSDHMIMNNFETIMKIETEWKNYELTEDMLLEMQRSLTKNTLDDPCDVGRFRTDKDTIVIGHITDPEKDFTPHKANSMKKEVKKLLLFANQKPPYDYFMWDFARATIVHFWLAYIHPFCDGNGRTARCLFYWYLLRNGFLSVGFVPISTRIKKSKAQYEKAFWLVEKEGGNLTHFFEYVIKQMKLAMKDFSLYEEKHIQEYQEKADLIGVFGAYNQRQIDLIYYFLQHHDQTTTIQKHQGYHHISYLTARSDIFLLEKDGYLAKKKRIKTWYFYPTTKLLDFFIAFGIDLSRIATTVIP